jgi:D-sedoheptulose 7-phosphate isomerase
MGKTSHIEPEFWRRALSQREAFFKVLAEGDLGRRLDRLGDVVSNAIAKGQKILLFGNGGSAADAQHAAAEWVGRFLTERNPLPAVALTTDTAVLTAVGNDYGFERIFERQVEALARPGDVVIGFSTSGESENVIRALRTAKKKGAHTVAFLGEKGGRARRLVEFPLLVPSTHAPVIQEAHGFLIHLLCEEVDRRLKKRRPKGSGSSKTRRGTGSSSQKRSGRG